MTQATGSSAGLAFLSRLSALIQERPPLLLPVVRILPPQHLAREQKPFRVSLALEGELGVVDALHAAFLERVGVRVEDRAALLLVVVADGGQALVARVADDLEAEAGDLAAVAGELE